MIENCGHEHPKMTPEEEEESYVAESACVEAADLTRYRSIIGFWHRDSHGRVQSLMLPFGYKPLPN